MKDDECVQLNCHEARFGYALASVGDVDADGFRGHRPLSLTTTVGCVHWRWPVSGGRGDRRATHKSHGHLQAGHVTKPNNLRHMCVCRQASSLHCHRSKGGDFAFSALTLLVGRQEKHLACKN